jgi:hypothetical protein
MTAWHLPTAAAGKGPRQYSAVVSRRRGHLLEVTLLKDLYWCWPV